MIFEMLLVKRLIIPQAPSIFNCSPKKLLFFRRKAQNNTTALADFAFNRNLPTHSSDQGLGNRHPQPRERRCFLHHGKNGRRYAPVFQARFLLHNLARRPESIQPTPNANKTTITPAIPNVAANELSVRFRSVSDRAPSASKKNRRHPMKTTLNLYYPRPRWSFANATKNHHWIKRTHISPHKMPLANAIGAFRCLSNVMQNRLKTSRQKASSPLNRLSDIRHQSCL